jgi:Fe-S-cluster containining protein
LVTGAYETYRQLVARVEAFARAIRGRYAGQIACQPGCDGCCYQTFTVFQVEAYHLAQTLATLTPEARERLQQRLQKQDDPWQMADQPRPCVLLEQGRCRLYEGRPLICRIHGYPIYSAMIEGAGGGQRDCCPLNFTDMPLHEIDSQAVYNLDLLNQTLAAINHCFVQDHGLPDQRVTIKQAVWQALENFPLSACPPLAKEGRGDFPEE